MTWSGSEDPSARDVVRFLLDGRICLLVSPSCGGRRPQLSSPPPLSSLPPLSRPRPFSPRAKSKSFQIGLYYSSALPPAPSEPIKFIDAARDPRHLSQGSGKAVFLVNNLRWNVTATMTNKVCCCCCCFRSFFPYPHAIH